MDRQRLVGVGLVLVSAASFGSGALFAKPVYGSGVDWLTLLAWRFLIGATAVLGLARRVGRAARRACAGCRAAGSRSRSGSASCTSATRGRTTPVSRRSRRRSPRSSCSSTRRSSPCSRCGSVIGSSAAGRGSPWRGPGRHGAGPRWDPGRCRAAAERPARRSSRRRSSTRSGSSCRPGWSGETTERVGGEAEDGADTAAATALMMVATAIGFWALAIATDRPVLPAERAQRPPGRGSSGSALISTFVAIQTFYAGHEADRRGPGLADLDLRAGLDDHPGRRSCSARRSGRSSSSAGPSSSAACILAQTVAATRPPRG